METQKPSRLLPTAVILFAIGMVASLTLLLPPVRDSSTVLVTTLYILALGAPAGFLLGLVFALRSGRRSR
ncbi:hypothetical protein JVX90_02060 [Gordonia sp. PDNC005]|uniref:hypothetical protein n=1 Tax=unclassified Gordonia (in: high G+C Gram-positive bacteria) TaxID=2657482 RepID=UPI0019669844|nr:hypothetical protein [Gordonia sp. PDNC005]QRY63055.1 hypothetical protein JVX90_02060 [Gordonia sp. PDNC005]